MTDHSNEQQNKKKFQDALFRYQKATASTAADKDEVFGNAAFMLGECYDYELGCTRDANKAFDLYAQAAQSLEQSAAYNSHHSAANLQRAHAAIARLSDEIESLKQFTQLPHGAHFDESGRLLNGDGTPLPDDLYLSDHGTLLKYEGNFLNNFRDK